MCRNIRFRGRRADGKWLFGDLTHNRGKVYIADDTIVDGDDIKGHTDFEVDPDTVGQYIGREDNNGNLLYTGDKVSFLFGGKNIEGIIEYSKTHASYYTRVYIGGVLSSLLTAIPTHCTIIGSIHE